MVKIQSIHTMTLRPGISDAQFEEFFRTRIATLPMPEGWHATLAKVDRGDGLGQYAIIYEIESLAARARYYPESGKPSEEAEQLFALQGDAWERLGELTTTPAGFTDYVRVE
jgi:hypothetical protein